MFKLMLKRVIILLPQLLFLSLVAFFLASSTMIVQTIMDSGAIQTTVIFDTVGFNDLIELYLDWIRMVFTRGDLGYSFSYQTTVVEIISERIFNTALMSIIALLFIYGIGIPFGIISGRKPGGKRDQVIQMITQFGASFPSFSMAMLMLLIFAFRLRWLPSGGSIPPGMTRDVGFITYYLTRVRHMMIPAMSLAMVQLIIPTQFLRGQIVETEQFEFVSLARAKGASENQVFKTHTLKNSLTSLIGSIPFQIAAILTSTIILESVFALPGIGDLFLTAFWWGDASLLKALILLFGFIILIATFIADVMLMAIDPRVKMDA